MLDVMLLNSIKNYDILKCKTKSEWEFYTKKENTKNKREKTNENKERAILICRFVTFSVRREAFC